MQKLLILLSFIGLTTCAFADTKPFNLSLTPDIAIQDSSDRIEGLTLSIWGQNEQASLALGFVNGSTGDSGGLSLGLLNYSDSYVGIQFGLVNYVKGDFTGWQDAAINYTEGTVTGLQSGWINYAGTLNGVQLGLLNYADGVKAGLQVGLLNVIPQNEWFTDLPNGLAPGMIFVNWRF